MLSVTPPLLLSRLPLQSRHSQSRMHLSQLMLSMKLLSPGGRQAPRQPGPHPAGCRVPRSRVGTNRRRLGGEAAYQVLGQARAAMRANIRRI